MADYIPDYILPYLSDKYYYDFKAANRPIFFIENFCFHYQGQFAGQKFVLLPWQKQLLHKTFGIKRRCDNLRRFTTTYLHIPRKQGKSSLAAVIALYLLCAGEEQGAEYYGAAGSRQQAGLIFQIMSNIISVSPVLRKELIVFKSHIEHRKTLSFYKVVSREGKTLHGTSPQGVIFDELHVQPDDKLMESFTTGMGFRRSPLMIIATTSGHSKAGFAYDYFEYARKVRDDQSLDESFLPIIYAAEDTDDWTNEETWIKVNPSIGHTTTLDFYRREFVKTRQMPSYENSFKLFYCNLHVDDSQAWITSTTWTECADDTLCIEDFEKQPCWVGLDLSSNNDISAIAVVFEKEGTFYVFPKPFVPELSIDNKERAHKVPYRAWVNGGYLTTTTGNQGLVVDYQAIVDYLDELRNRFDVQSIYFDPWNSTSMINLLQNDHMDVLVQTRQGFKTLSPLTNETEKLIISKKLRHPNNPVLNWNVMNVVLETDSAGNIKPSKKKSANKIDCAVATIMAVGGAAAELYVDEGTADVLFL